MSKKEAYQKNLQAQMDDCSLELDKLKAKADQAEADMQLKYYEEIEKIRDKKKNVDKKLDELKSASEEAWEDLKEGIEIAWVSLESGFQSARSKFK